MKFFKPKSIMTLLIVLLVTIPALALSEEIQYKMNDAGVMNHSRHGKGIYLQITLKAMPKGGLQSEIISKSMFDMCKTYAPKTIPLITKKLKVKKPKFVAVRVISGNKNFGRYVLKAYSIKNGTCGKQL